MRDPGDDRAALIGTPAVAARGPPVPRISGAEPTRVALPLRSFVDNLAAQVCQQLRRRGFAYVVGQGTQWVSRERKAMEIEISHPRRHEADLVAAEVEPDQARAVHQLVNPHDAVVAQVDCRKTRQRGQARWECAEGVVRGRELLQRIASAQLERMQRIVAEQHGVQRGHGEGEALQPILTQVELVQRRGRCQEIRWEGGQPVLAELQLRERRKPAQAGRQAREPVV